MLCSECVGLPLYISVFRTHLQQSNYVVIYSAFRAVAVTYGKMSLDSNAHVDIDGQRHSVKHAVQSN